MPPTIQNKRGTASDIATVNPVLLAGEIAFETDTNRFKVGNGTTAWNSLPYAAQISSGATISGVNIISSSGNFNTLTVSSVPVSVSGHSHTSSNITNFNTAVSGLVSGIYQPLLTNPITGVGTSGYVSRWNGTNSVTSGIIFDNGSGIGIGTTNPVGALDILGNVRISGVSVTSLTMYDNGTSSYSSLDMNGNNFTANNKHIVAGFGVGVRGNRGTNVGMDSNGSNGYLALAAGGGEKVRITTAGTVGIGTTTPSGLLDVAGDVYIRGTGNNLGTIYLKSASSTDTANRVRVDTNGNLYLDAGPFFRAGSQDGSAEIQATSTFVRIGHGYNANSINQNIQFRPANTERMRITSDGNVGIGTSTPSGQLHVIGTGIVSSRLGIGTTSPQYPLDVSGNANISGTLSVSGIPLGEIIDDEVAGLLVAGSGITLNYNDSANTLTVDSNVSTSLVAGTGISLNYNVTTDELSINTSGVSLVGHTHSHSDVSNVLTTLSQFTTSQNDLSLGSGGIIRISSSGTLNITGFVATSGGDARLLSNVGSGIITLKHNNTSSSSDNRIFCVNNSDFDIAANGSAAIYYDSIDNKWRVG